MATKTSEEKILETAVIFAGDLAYLIPADENEQGIIGKAQWVIQKAREFEEKHQAIAKEKGIDYDYDYWEDACFVTASEDFTSEIAKSDEVIPLPPTFEVMKWVIEGLRHMKGRLGFVEFCHEIYGEEILGNQYKYLKPLEETREAYLAGKYKRFDKEGVLALWEDLDMEHRRRFLRALMKSIEILQEYNRSCP